MKETDIAWAAGIIDGEGCISLRRERTGYNFRLVVVNTSKLMVQRLAGIFPAAKVRLYHVGTPKWRPRYEWVLSTAHAERAVRTLLPHLTAKRAEAEMWLYARTLIGSKGDADGRRNPHRDQLDGLVQSLKELKHYRD